MDLGNFIRYSLCIWLSFAALVTRAETNAPSVLLRLSEQRCENLPTPYQIDLPPVGHAKHSLNAVNETIDQKFGKECAVVGIAFTGEINITAVQQLSLAIDVYKSRPTRREDSQLGRDVLYINSPGGLIAAAMEIGFMVSKAELAVAVLENCESACLFVYAAGTTRAGIDRIGIHRPFAKDIPTEDLTYSEYLQYYDGLTDRMKVYLKRFGVSPAVVDRMNAVPSDKMVYLTSAEAESLGLGGKNIAHWEYMKAKITQICGNGLYNQLVENRKREDECWDTTLTRKERERCWAWAQAAWTATKQERSACLSKLLPPHHNRQTTQSLTTPTK